MILIVDGSRIRLDKANVLGSGGEGTVFRYSQNGQNLAIKVYTNPTNKKALKLTQLIKSGFVLPERVLAPSQLAYDATYSKVVGFVMPLLPIDVEEVRSLSSRKFRSTFAVTTKKVAEIFLDGLPTLKLIHKQGLVVGDLSDLNVLFRDNSMLWIDVDSWQFGSFECPVATEAFIDPMLYGVDLSKGVKFKPENDWYSFAVMLFRSLLLVHPYGGTHKIAKSLVERAQRRIFVLNPKVVYPKIALSPDILSDELGQIFYQYFAQGLRRAFPETTLRQYWESLVECKICKTWYPGSRRICPICSAKTIIVVEQPKPVRGVTVVQLLSTPGRIIYTKVADVLSVIAIENGKTVLYRLGENNPPCVLFDEIPGTRFAIFGNTLVVNPPHTSDLWLYDISQDTVRKIAKTTTEMFMGNRKAVFRTTRQNLLRIAGSTLLCTEITDQKLIERPLRQVVEKQTWFSADENSDEPVVFGFFQVLRQQMYWLIRDGKTLDVSIPQLGNEEVLLDLSVKFDSSTTLLVRQTQEKGIDYIRREIVDAKGEVVFSQRMRKDEAVSPLVHGKAYWMQTLVHPSDDGLVQEKIQSGNLKTFPETQKYVSSGDILERFQGGLLVIKDDKILRLSLS